MANQQTRNEQNRILSVAAETYLESLEGKIREAMAQASEKLSKGYETAGLNKWDQILKTMKAANDRIDKILYT
jgi:hypothetical protein